MTVQELVIDTINRNKNFLGISQSDEILPGTCLFGERGILDSLNLVHLIVELEKSVQLTFQRQVTLADVKAFSAKKSPFKDVASLTIFIEENLK
jgi:acyl carrier protein